MEYIALMPVNVNNMLVISKTADEKAFALGQEISSWLGKNRVQSRVARHEQWIHEKDPRVNGVLPDMVLTLGGDGTFISVAAALIPSGIPALGLNMGRLGFLTELSPDTWLDDLSAVVNGRYGVEDRLVLGFRLIRSGAEVEKGLAVNDLVVGRGATARLLKLELRVDGEMLCSLRADGVVLSTPTGSTAYGASAGGPILHPGLSAMAVTTVCPFLNAFRPQVVPGESRLAVVVEDVGGECCLTRDGQDATSLESGDRVEIFKNEQPLRLAVVKPGCHYLKLKTKGFITGS